MLDCRVLETNKFFLKLKECEQNPKWHSEGNAFNHTLMVYNAMVEKLKDDTYYDDYKKDILLNAALYHDIGKSVTTKWSNEKNSWTSPYHAIEGEKLTRFILWNEDFRWREKVCSLVRNHMKPLNMFEGNRTDEYREKEIIKLSWSCNIRELILLKECDNLGSIIMDEDNWRDKLEWIKNTAKRLECYTSHKPFPSHKARFDYFNGLDENLPNGLKVYVMIGIPGSGKSTWVEKNVPELPVISREKIRQELGISIKGIGNKEQEEQVTEVFYERLLEAAEHNPAVVIDNTNIRICDRRKHYEALKKFNPEMIYVYHEAPKIEDNYDRRNGEIEAGIIDKLRASMDYPTPSEYHQIIINKQK